MPKNIILNSEQIKTLRRRVSDVICKDHDICIKVIILALKTGKIKHYDIISEDERIALLNSH